MSNLLLNNHWIAGLLLLVVCSLIFNGAANGEPYSFDYSRWASDGEGSAGGGD